MVKRHTPVLIAFFAGLIAIIADVVGSTRLFKIIFEIAGQYVPAATQVFGWVLMGLNFFASLGGITVIVGGIAIHTRHDTLGRFLIGIGIGIGLIGLIVSLVIAAIGGTLISAALSLIISLITIRGLAIILSIIARQTSSKIEV